MVRTSRMAFAGENAGRAQEILSARFRLSGRRSADLPKRHFQGGQGLRCGFVQLTSDAALLFAAQGEELAREAAEVIFDTGLLGDVVIEADDADDATVGDRCRECRGCERRGDYRRA